MNESRSITGLDPVQDVVCELLDIVEKITIDGNTPTVNNFYHIVLLRIQPSIKT